MTPLTVAVRVLAVPAVVPVKVAVYVPGVAVAVTVPKVPALVPPARVKPKALLARPLTALPVVSSTTMVSRSVLPEVAVELAKLIDGVRAADRLLTAVRELVGGRDGRGAIAEDRLVHVGVGVVADVIGLVDSRLDRDIHGARTARDNRGDLRIAHIGDRAGGGGAEEHRQVAGRSREVLAGDGDGAAGGTAGRAQAGHHGCQVDHLEVAGVQRLAGRSSEDVVHVPGQVEVGRSTLSTVAEEPVTYIAAADVRDDQAVLLHGGGDDLGLGGHRGDQGVDGRRVCQAQAAAEGQIVGSLGSLTMCEAG